MSEELDKLKFDREVLTSDREFELKQREQEIREDELKKPFWRDPVVVGIAGAILALLGNIYATYKNADLAAKTSRQNALLQSIIEVIHNEPGKAQAKLDVLVRSGLIDDPNNKIRDAVNSNLFTLLQATSNSKSSPPSSSTSSSSTPSSSTSKPTVKGVTVEETVLAQKTIDVAPGGYAREPDPACTIPEFNSPELIVPKFGNDSSELFSPPNNTAPTCVAVRLVIPAGKKVSRIVLGASEDGQNWLPCVTPDGLWDICGVGWSAWGKFEGPTFVVGVFKNWSHDRTRKAKITVLGTD
jgi:hypothetical protein